MKVRCVNNKSGVVGECDFVTVGKEYKVKDVGDFYGMAHISDDNGEDICIYLNGKTWNGTYEVVEEVKETMKVWEMLKEIKEDRTKKFEYVSSKTGEFIGEIFVEPFSYKFWKLMIKNRYNEVNPFFINQHLIDCEYREITKKSEKDLAIERAEQKLAEARAELELARGMK